MTTQDHITAGESPAIRADQCSRITKIVACILRRKVFASDQLAHTVAAEVADGLIDEFGGGMMYVPIADRRAGVTNHEAIERSLRSVLEPGFLSRTAKAPRALMESVAVKHGVGRRTVERVLQRLRNTQE